jgi:uncharacterized membrane protein
MRPALPGATISLVGSAILAFLATFLAGAVEAVEALTIVLAVGVVRGWRSSSSS